MFLSEKLRYFRCKEKRFCRDLQDILGFMPHNLEIYHEALRHGSINYQTGIYTGKNNERLEYLGDAILGAVVSDILYHNYPKRNEGFLTKARSMMVRRETLNDIAHEIGLDKLICAALNMKKKSHNCSISGNAFEAFVGAIYLDRGYDYCYRFIENRVFSAKNAQFNVDELASKEMNYKSSIIEWCQKYHYHYTFMLDSEEDTPEGILFHSSIIICGIQAGQGKGYTKKESHQQAALEALNNIRQKHQVLEDIRNAAYEISEQRLKDREERLAAREEKELTFGPVDEMLSDVADNLGTETESKNEQEYGID
ncbi:MAG: ribonuclease III [Bacteroidaceae bacterium]|nr:ribonuclease III [Bacteroidaceae bacterium]